MDSLLSFSTWYQYTEILSLCHLVVNTRPNFNLNTANAATIALLKKHKINTIEKLRQQPFGGIYFTQINEENISSTQIRHQLRQGKNCTELMPEAIYRYIKNQQLYLN
jgi:nicotinate-nucleotide adenylyltransferase